MFHCPENDIHSIYIDGELPQNFVKDYEAHVASCQKCRAKLEKLKKIRAALSADSDSIVVLDDFKAKSFERLQSRMRFSRVVKDAEPSRNIVRVGQFVPLAAAAALLLALVLPAKTGMSVSSQIDDGALAISSVKAQKPIADSDIVVSGGIHSVSLDKNAGQPLSLRASDFESLKSDAEPSDGAMTISVTKLSNLNSISASNVANVASTRLDFLDILK